MIDKWIKIKDKEIHGKSMCITKNALFKPSYLTMYHVICYRVANGFKWNCTMATSTSWAQDVIICNLCENPALRFCNSCQTDLCLNCVGKHLHESESLSHDIVSFQHRKIRLVLPECKFHPGQRCEVHCQQCHTPVCKTLHTHWCFALLTMSLASLTWMKLALR